MQRYSLLFAATLCVGCGYQPTSETTSKSTVIEVTPASFNEEGAPTVEFDVPGMHCGACAAGVCKALKETPGVVDVKADAGAKTATVAIDESAFDAEAALAAIAEKYGEATVKEAVEEAAESVEEAAEATTES